MPSIAQQDYIVIAPKVGYTISVDAYALGQLAKILEKGDTSIFDVIVKNIALFESDADPNYGRVLGVNPQPYVISFWDNANGENYNLDMDYTFTQYEGLAAVQEAGEVQYPGTGLTEDLPSFHKTGSFITEQVLGEFITDLEGHKISVTANNGKIATVAISEETYPDGIKVPFEEIQKLIGLPITV